MPPQHLLDDPIPVIGYVRVSTWREENISPEIQRAAIITWAAAQNRRIVDWIEDLDQTGRNFKRKIMRAISLIEAGTVQEIAVWKYNRFGRDRHGIAVNLQRVERVGGQLQSATEDVDARTATGRFQRGILFEVAAFESDRAGEMWTETHALRRAAGVPATGGSRFGYIWHPRRLPDPDHPGRWILQDERYEPDPETADDAADLFVRKVAGTAYAPLAAWLNSCGRRTMEGSLWTMDSVRKYMRSGFAAGLLHVHDPTCPCAFQANRWRCSENRWTHIPGAHPALIKPELWQAFLGHCASHVGRSPRTYQALYPLSGLGRCGHCRSDLGHLSATRKGQNIRGYALQCNGRTRLARSTCDGVWVRRTVVEAAVREWLSTTAAEGVDAAPPTPTPPTDDTGQQSAAQRAHAEADIKRAQAGLQRLAVNHALTPDMYPPGIYEASRDELTARKQAAERRLEALTSATPRTLHAHEYTPIVVGLVEEWDTITVEEQNSLLRQLIRRVAVRRAPNIGRSVVAGVEIHPVWEPDPWANAA